jgi:hypothetical protein
MATVVSAETLENPLRFGALSIKPELYRVSEKFLRTCYSSLFTARLVEGNGEDVLLGRGGRR